MGIKKTNRIQTTLSNIIQCQEEKEKVKEKEEEKPEVDPPELELHSQLVELPDTSEMVDTPPESEPVPQSTLLLFWNISALKFSNLLVMPLKTTKDKESPQDSLLSLSEMTKNLAPSLLMLQLLKVVFFHIFTHLSSQR